MTRKQWARRRLVQGLLLMPGGLALALWGAFRSTGEDAMLSIAIGLLGVLAITFGALAVRLAVAGPYPEWLEPEAQA